MVPKSRIFYYSWTRTFDFTVLDCGAVGDISLSQPFEVISMSDIMCKQRSFPCYKRRERTDREIVTLRECWVINPLVPSIYRFSGDPVNLLCCVRLCLLVVFGFDPIACYTYLYFLSFFILFSFLYGSIVIFVQVFFFYIDSHRLYYTAALLWLYEIALSEIFWTITPLRVPKLSLKSLQTTTGKIWKGCWFFW